MSQLNESARRSFLFPSLWFCPDFQLEKEMATHSSVLAWKIPGTAEPGGLPSMGLHRVGHDWSDLAAAAAADFQIIGWGSPTLGKAIGYSQVIDLNINLI